MPAPRMARMSLLLGSRVVISISLPSGRRQRISPSSTRPGLSMMLRIARPTVLLPQPLSPTTPRVSPCLIFEVDSVDRPHDAFVGGVVDLQIVDLNYRIFR